MLMVINGSYWSGEEEGQTEGWDVLEKRKMGHRYGMGTFGRVDWKLDIQSLFCFGCQVNKLRSSHALTFIVGLLRVYAAIYNTWYYPLTLNELLNECTGQWYWPGLCVGTCGIVYLHCWLQFKACHCAILRIIPVNIKGQETVCPHLQPSDTRLWSDFSGSVLLPAGQFRSGLRLHSLSSTFPWKSIHLYSFTHLLPAPFHPMSSCTLIPLGGAFTSYQHLSYSHRQYSYGFILHPHYSDTLLGNGSFRYFSRKKKPKRLSISFLPGHENYGFPNE